MCTVGEHRSPGRSCITDDIKSPPVRGHCSRDGQLNVQTQRKAQNHLEGGAADLRDNANAGGKARAKEEDDQAGDAEERGTGQLVRGAQHKEIKLGVGRVAAGWGEGGDEER